MQCKGGEAIDTHAHMSSASTLSFAPSPRKWVHPRRQRQEAACGRTFLRAEE